MEERILDWLIPFLCGLVASLIASIVSVMKKKGKKARLLEDGVESLLRLEIVRSYNEYTEKGFCPIYAKESLTRAYNDYHALGGNDVATGLYNDIMKLPTEREEKHYEGKEGNYNKDCCACNSTH